MKISLKKLISEMGGQEEKPRFRVRIPSDTSISNPPKKINRGAGGHSSWGSRPQDPISPSNSVWDIIDWLKDHPGSTEGEINQGAFGYDRNRKNQFGYGENNKKYADLLRRAVAKGLIVRAEKASGPGRKGGVVYSVAPTAQK